MSFAAILGVIAAAALLALVFLALVARLNHAEDDDGEPAILIGPAEPDPEPMGDQVDVRAILNRYSGD